MYVPAHVRRKEYFLNSRSDEATLSEGVYEPHHQSIVISQSSILRQCYGHFNKTVNISAYVVESVGR